MTDYIVTGWPSLYKIRLPPYNLVLTYATGVGSTVTATLGTADETQLIAENIIVLASYGPPWAPVQHTYLR